MVFRMLLVAGRIFSVWKGYGLTIFRRRSREGLEMLNQLKHRIRRTFPWQEREARPRERRAKERSGPVRRV